MTELTHERLTELLDYDPESGVFVWKNDPVRSAGCVNSSGYTKIKVDQRDYYAHRLAWFYVHGEFPEIMDHVNGDKSDNRISNLRPATQSQNAANSRRPSSNTSGVKGVSFHKAARKWRAYIGKRHLGLFDEKAEAVSARIAAAEAEYGEFMRVA